MGQDLEVFQGKILFPVAWEDFPKKIPRISYFEISQPPPFHTVAGF